MHPEVHEVSSPQRPQRSIPKAKWSTGPVTLNHCQWSLVSLTNPNGEENLSKGVYCGLVSVVMCSSVFLGD